MPNATSAARDTYTEFKDHEWLTIEQKILKWRLQPQTRQHLTAITKRFALSVKTQKTIIKQLDYKTQQLIAWQRKTEKLAASLGDTNSIPYRRNRDTFEKIAEAHFYPEMTPEECNYPLALIQRTMFGASKTVSYVQDYIEYSPASYKRFSAELWFLWACVIFRILRDAKTPLKFSGTKRLKPGRAKLIERLQLTLPIELQLRKYDSIKRSAVEAFKLSYHCNVETLEDVFDKWLGGEINYARDTAPFPFDAKNSYLRFAMDFERHFDQSIGISRKGMGMGEK